MDINPEILKRIFAAATQLYDAANRATVPTVSAVRRLAKTSMNDTSEAMKAWRAEQINLTIPTTVSIPEALRHINENALVALWSAAQEQADSALRAAQAGWQAERIAAEAERAQIITDFDEQAEELTAARRAVSEAAVSLADIRVAEAQVRANLTKRNEECNTLNSEISALERVIAELRGQVAASNQALDRALNDAHRIQHDLDEARQSTQAEIGNLKTELAVALGARDGAIAQTEAFRRERDQALNALLEVRDIAANLRGEVTALSRQNENLFAELRSK